MHAVLVPYFCGLGNNTRANVDCLLKPESINITELTDQTEKYASKGLVDPTSNMLNDRVFIYHGKDDPRVLPGYTIL